MNDPQARQESLDVTPELLMRYDRPGPRYTSYPTAPEWKPDFGPAQYRAALDRAATRTREPLSLYIHLPFCHRRCAFCGCNSLGPAEEGVAARYVDYVDRELELLAAMLSDTRPLGQLHWGGGTPTYLSARQMEALFGTISRRFTIEPDAELAIEVDPRATTREHVRALRRLGFNRISMGVQDLDPDVQREIGRNQSEEETVRLVDWCRDAGFEGLNMDLIYGLPGQNAATWDRTLSRIIDVRPDRLAVYSYAYLPEKLHNQRAIDAAKLPSTPEKYSLFARARRRFTEAGYRAIGMDHFALPHDELTHALDERRLRRNFMGYTVAPASDMIGVGVSAIGEIGGVYAQNAKTLDPYMAALDRSDFPTACGCVLSRDDQVRSWVIRQLMCNFHLDARELRKRFGVEYEAYFATEEQELASFYEEGFLDKDGGNLRILPLGQVFIRNIAMVFDAYLAKSASAHRFSRTV